MKQSSRTSSSSPQTNVQDNQNPSKVEINEGSPSEGLYSPSALPVKSQTTNLDQLTDRLSNVKSSKARQAIFQSVQRTYGNAQAASLARSYTKTKLQDKSPSLLTSLNLETTNVVGQIHSTIQRDDTVAVAEPPAQVAQLPGQVEQEEEEIQEEENEEQGVGGGDQAGPEAVEDAPSQKAPLYSRMWQGGKAASNLMIEGTGAFSSGIRARGGAHASEINENSKMGDGPLPEKNVKKAWAYTKAGTKRVGGYAGSKVVSGASKAVGYGAQGLGYVGAAGTMAATGVGVGAVYGVTKLGEGAVFAGKKGKQGLNYASKQSVKGANHVKNKVVDYATRFGINSSLQDFDRKLNKLIYLQQWFAADVEFLKNVPTQKQDLNSQLETLKNQQSIDDAVNQKKSFLSKRLAKATDRSSSKIEELEGKLKKYTAAEATTEEATKSLSDLQELIGSNRLAESKIHETIFDLHKNAKTAGAGAYNKDYAEETGAVKGRLTDLIKFTTTKITEYKGKKNNWRNPDIGRGESKATRGAKQALGAGTALLSGGLANVGIDKNRDQALGGYSTSLKVNALPAASSVKAGITSLNDKRTGAITSDEAPQTMQLDAELSNIQQYVREANERLDQLYEDQFTVDQLARWLKTDSETVSEPNFQDGKIEGWLKQKTSLTNDKVKLVKSQKSAVKNQSKINSNDADLLKIDQEIQDYRQTLKNEANDRGELARLSHEIVFLEYTRINEPNGTYDKVLQDYDKAEGDVEGLKKGTIYNNNAEARKAVGSNLIRIKGLIFERLEEMRKSSIEAASRKNDLTAQKTYVEKTYGRGEGLGMRITKAVGAKVATAATLGLVSFAYDKTDRDDTGKYRSAKVLPAGFTPENQKDSRFKKVLKSFGPYATLVNTIKKLRHDKADLDAIWKGNVYGNKFATGFYMGLKIGSNMILEPIRDFALTLGALLGALAILIFPAAPILGPLAAIVSGLGLVVAAVKIAFDSIRTLWNLVVLAKRGYSNQVVDARSNRMVRNEGKAAGSDVITGAVSMTAAIANLGVQGGNLGAINPLAHGQGNYLNNQLGYYSPLTQNNAYTTLPGIDVLNHTKQDLNKMSPSLLGSIEHGKMERPIAQFGMKGVNSGMKIPGGVLTPAFQELLDQQIKEKRMGDAGTTYQEVLDFAQQERRKAQAVELKQKIKDAMPSVSKMSIQAAEGGAQVNAGLQVVSGQAENPTNINSEIDPTDPAIGQVGSDVASASSAASDQISGITRVSGDIEESFGTALTEVDKPVSEQEEQEVASGV